LTADVTPSDANRLHGFTNPPAGASQLSGFSAMRMMSLAAAPTYNGVETLHVVVDTQTFDVEVPITAARLQAGTPITVGDGPVAMAASGDHVYVVSQNPVEDPITFEQKYYVSVIDTTTNMKLTDIEVGERPTGITATRPHLCRQQRRSNHHGDRRHHQHSDRPDRLNRPVFPTPFNIVASDDGTRLYVAVGSRR
jgi:hypothetical protein